jgi:hypothetical protein
MPVDVQFLAAAIVMSYRILLATVDLFIYFIASFYYTISPLQDYKYSLCSLT